ncbi:hypothetical protein [Burkholderia sp. LMG 32019]|uniref:hypothetical protein n=1 Tax=Burkholderia sp. LMG 32019 TaxID=3158173 RepID=UPI003C2B6B7C
MSGQIRIHRYGSFGRRCFLNRLSSALFIPDTDCRAISSGLIQHRFPGMNDATRQYSGVPLPRHSREKPAIFTDNASPNPVIGHDKNAWRTHGQMQRKV